MLQRSVPRTSPLPGRPVRVLIESADLASQPVPARRLGGVEVAICSGPTSLEDACPLVTEGVCPMGDCDVVASELEGPWAPSVRNAWLRNGVVVTSTRGAASSPEDRFDAHLGAALSALYRTAYLQRTSARSEPNMDSPEDAAEGEDQSEHQSEGEDEALWPMTRWAVNAFGSQLTGAPATRP